MKDAVCKKYPSQERLKELLDYDPITGVFTWKVYRAENAKAGFVAGSINAIGYRSILVDRRLFLAHRLAWIFCHGLIPEGMCIDHINGQKVDNRLANLRLATTAQNMSNRFRCNSNSASGIRGVSLSKRSQKWRAVIMHLGKQISAGHFASKEEAARAVEAKRLEVFGRFSGGSQSAVGDS